MKGKQRSYLKKLAHTLSPIMHIGKKEITDNVIAQVDELLESKELIKIKVLNNNLLSAQEVANLLCEKLDAEFVQAIGNKCVIYREASEDPEIKLP